jgi:hypothetical protein
LCFLSSFPFFLFFPICSRLVILCPHLLLLLSYFILVILLLVLLYLLFLLLILLMLPPISFPSSRLLIPGVWIGKSPLRITTFSPPWPEL